jgi:hypothetical protein
MKQKARVLVGVFLLTLLFVTMQANSASAKTYQCVIGGFVRPGLSGYSDVKYNDPLWAYFEIMAATRAAVMGGYEEYGSYYCPSSCYYVYMYDFAPKPYPSSGKPYQPLPWWITSINVAFEADIPCSSGEDQWVLRETAVDVLIKAIGLEDEAMSLSSTEVENILKRFPDNHQVNSPYRNTVALAIKYGILRGYDDGYLKPDNRMNRAEAACLLVRSAVIRTIPDKNTLQVGETTDIAIKRWSYYGTVKSSKVQIKNVATEQIVREWSWSEAPPSQIAWDGKDKQGTQVPPGEYIVQGVLTISDLYSTRTFNGAPMPIHVMAVGPAKPVITSPANGANIGTNTITTIWSAEHPAGLSINTYELEIGRTSDFSNLLWSGSGSVPQGQKQMVNGVAKYPNTSRTSDDDDPVWWTY